MTNTPRPSTATELKAAKAEYARRRMKMIAHWNATLIDSRSLPPARENARQAIAYHEAATWDSIMVQERDDILETVRCVLEATIPELA